MLALKAGVDPRALAREWPRRTEVPFDPAHRLMATFHESAGGDRLLAVKGAPGVVVDRATHRQTAAGVVPLGDADREALRERNRALAGQGGPGPGARLAGRMGRRRERWTG